MKLPDYQQQEKPEKEREASRGDEDKACRTAAAAASRGCVKQHKIKAVHAYTLLYTPKKTHKNL